MSDVLKYTRNVKLIVEISKEVYQRTGIPSIIEVFEQNSCTEGIFYFLQPFEQKDSATYYKFIEASLKLNQI